MMEGLEKDGNGSKKKNGSAYGKKMEDKEKREKGRQTNPARLCIKPKVDGELR